MGGGNFRKLLRVSPEVSFEGKEPSATLMVQHQAENNVRLSLSCSDATFGHKTGGGVSLNGVTARVGKPGHFGVMVDAATLTANMFVRQVTEIGGKDAALWLNHNGEKNKGLVNASVMVNDDLEVGVHHHGYNLSHENVRLSARYNNDGIVFCPNLNIGDKSAMISVHKGLNRLGKLKKKENSGWSVGAGSHTKRAFVEYAMRMDDGQLDLHVGTTLDGDAANNVEVSVGKNFEFEL